MELIIARLIGRAETGGAERPPASHAEEYALAQRLRALVGEEAEGARSDHGPAAEALQLAAYLDGAMEPAARAAFECELVRSPHRRDELLSTAAWLDELAARQELPPADATVLAMSLDTPVSVTSAKPSRQARGFAAFVERLLPQRRFAIASALATVLIAVVGVDIALRISPPLAPPAAEQGQVIRSFRDAPSALQAGQRNVMILTAETINALIAFQEQQPADAQRAELLRTLARAGASALDAGNVRAVTLQPRLSEYLARRTGPLPTTISATLAPDGTLALERAD
jgi:hypothetical protein